MSLLHHDVESDGDGFNNGEFDNDTVLIGRTEVREGIPELHTDLRTTRFGSQPREGESRRPDSSPYRR